MYLFLLSLLSRQSVYRRGDANRHWFRNLRCFRHRFWFRTQSNRHWRFAPLAAHASPLVPQLSLVSSVEQLSLVPQPSFFILYSCLVFNNHASGSFRLLLHHIYICIYIIYNMIFYVIFNMKTCRRTQRVVYISVSLAEPTAVALVAEACLVVKLETTAARLLCGNIAHV